MDLKKYLKNIISVSGLTFASQALSLLTTPILSRIFSPNDYGEIAIYTSIIAIMEACASLSYVSGIALDKDLKDAKATTKLCIYVTCIVGIIGMLVVALINIFAESSELLRLFILVLPIMVIFPDISAALEGWLKRCRKYNYIGILNIINVLLTFALSLLMGVMGYEAKGLLLARCASAIAFSMIVYIVACISTDYRKYRIRICDIKKQAIYHRRFPLFQMPLVIMNSFSGQLPTIIMTSHFPANEIGNYTKGYSISSIPSQVIGKSVGSVFYQESALLEDDKELKSICLFTFKRLLLISGLMVLGLASLGPVLFKFVLGEQWLQAGVYSAIMAPMVAGVFITQPLSHLVFVKQKQHMGIPIGIIMIATRVAILTIAICFNYDFETTLYLYSVSSSLMYIGINGYYLSLARIKKSTSLIYPTAIIFTAWVLGLFLQRIIGAI